MFEPREKLLTVDEVAEWLRVGKDWVRQHANGHRNPVLQSVKIGKSHKFRREVVQAFIADCERATEEHRKRAR